MGPTPRHRYFYQASGHRRGGSPLLVGGWPLDRVPLRWKAEQSASERRTAAENRGRGHVVLWSLERRRRHHFRHRPALAAVPRSRIWRNAAANYRTGYDAHRELAPDARLP